MKIANLEDGEPLKLTNSGNLEVVPLGVGSMLSTSFHNTNYLVIKGDTHLMIDAGSTTLSSLRALGLKPQQILNILPTHAHDDHIGGIGALAVANRFIGQMKEGKPKLNLLAPRDFAGQLWEETLKGGLACNEMKKKGKQGPGAWFNLVSPKLVCFEYRETAFYDFGSMEIRTFRVMHVPYDAESWRDSAYGVGVLIDNRVFISGDTRFDQELIDTYAPQSEFMFHDATFHPDPVHASIEELRTLPADIKRKMSLIHFDEDALKADVSDFVGLTKQGVRYIFD